MSPSPAWVLDTARADVEQHAARHHASGWDLVDGSRLAPSALEPLSPLIADVSLATVPAP